MGARRGAPGAGGLWSGQVRGLERVDITTFLSLESPVYILRQAAAAGLRSNQGRRPRISLLVETSWYKLPLCVQLKLEVACFGSGKTSFCLLLLTVTGLHDALILRGEVK